MVMYNVCGNIVSKTMDGIIIEENTIVSTWNYSAENNITYKRETIDSRVIKYPGRVTELDWGLKYADEYYTPPRNTSITALTCPGRGNCGPFGALIRIPGGNVFLDRVRANIEKYGDPGHNFKREFKILYTQKQSIFRVGDFIFITGKDYVIAYTRDFGLDGVYIVTPKDALMYALGYEFKGKLFENYMMSQVPYLLDLMYTEVKVRKIDDDSQNVAKPCTKIHDGKHCWKISAKDFEIYRENCDDDSMGELIATNDDSPGHTYHVFIRKGDQVFVTNASEKEVTSFHDFIAAADVAKVWVVKKEDFEKHFDLDYHALGIGKKLLYAGNNKFNVPLVGKNIGYTVTRSKKGIEIAFYDGEKKKTIIRIPENIKLEFIKSSLPKELLSNILYTKSKESVYNDLLKVKVELGNSKISFSGEITPFGASELEDYISTFTEFDVV